MARRSVETKIINGKEYYTSTYFANETGMDNRSARKFLEDFQSLDGHVNPRLYDEKTMEKALNACMNETRLQTILEEKAKELASKEEDEWLDLVGIDVEGTSDKDEFVESFKENIAKDYKLEFIIMLLKHVLFNQGYIFDEMQFNDDLLNRSITDNIMEAGGMRSTDSMKVIERLESYNAYLIKK